jgi:hypothetical protein
MNRRTTLALMTMTLLGLAVATALPRAGFAQTNMANWKLNLAKSTYSPGPAPKSSTFNFQVEGQNLKNTVEGIDAEGKPTKAVFIHIYDGKPYPTTGAPGIDSSAYTRVDANIVKFTRMNAGKPIQTGFHVVSSDGKTLTVITTGTGPNGREINNFAVYEKQ